MARKKSKAAPPDAEVVDRVDIYIPGVQLLPVDELIPTIGNPNEMSADEMERLISEIKDVGFIDPLQVVPLKDGMYIIVGGEHRWEAAKAIGMLKVPCSVLDGDRWQEEDVRQLVMVRLNSLHGKMNPEKMAVIYRKMAERYGEKALQKLFAYTDKQAWAKVVNSVRKGLKAAGLPKNKVKKFDEDVKEAKTVDDLGHVLNHLLNRYGETMDHSFMVFAFGGREHIYIAMGKRTQKAMDKVMEYCRSWSVDINEILAEVTEEWAKAAEAREAEDLGGDSDVE